MKCYTCHESVNSVVRVHMPPKDKRECAQFRDVRGPCYKKHMEAKGYTCTKGKTALWFKGEEYDLQPH